MDRCHQVDPASKLRKILGLVTLSQVLTAKLSWMDMYFYLQSAYAKAMTMDWKIGDTVAGQVRAGGGLTFAAVEGAGHMVPMDQPATVSIHIDL